MSMFFAGTLGTVIGDYCSHNLHLGDGGAAILLSPILGLLFLAARGDLLRSLWFYWLTVVTVRAAGTAVGDFVSGRGLLGLPLSTLVTGALFVGLLIAWREPTPPKLVGVGTGPIRPSRHLGVARPLLYLGDRRGTASRFAASVATGGDDHANLIRCGPCPLRVSRAQSDYARITSGKFKSW
jgi:hypothetical protein